MVMMTIEAKSTSTKLKSKVPYPDPIGVQQAKKPKLMACPSLLHSSASSFHGRFPALSSSSYVRPTYPNPINVNGVVSVKAAAGGIVLVEKSEAEKTGRLKTTYLEKIVPLLREEFSYTNIHQVTCFITSFFFCF